MSRAFVIVLILIPVTIFGLAVYYYGVLTRDVSSGRVIVGDKEFSVDVADSVLTRQKGLSGRENLADDEGMLFVFSKAGVHRFWMKDMLIPIDIIWINGDEVVGIEREVYPEPGVPTPGLTIYKPPIPVNLVLEVPSGAAERAGVEVGDSVSVRL